MQFRYYLYCLALLSGCTKMKHSDQTADTAKPSEHVESPPQQEPTPDVAQTPAPETPPPQQSNQTDAGIKIILMTEAIARNMDVMSIYQADPEFAKLLVVVYDIPGNPPYQLEQKRLFQTHPNVYSPSAALSPETLLGCKNHNIPAFFFINSRGYLPGEQVSIRISGQGAQREATFYPRPLLLKRPSGELLATITLLQTQSDATMYEFDICGVGKEEKYKFVSTSGPESFSHDLQGPIKGSLIPDVVDLRKGIAKLELHLEDGTSSAIELPWGDEMLEYKRGNK